MSYTPQTNSTMEPCRPRRVSIDETKNQVVEIENCLVPAAKQEPPSSSAKRKQPAEFVKDEWGTYYFSEERECKS
ncbi:hypothetical protein BASA81_000811 [Batrachochytrium salamandrivorans]|nr:hypothetical protein BASA81_000811 [Batrachochytrium salamandrivorans]